MVTPEKQYIYLENGMLRQAQMILAVSKMVKKTSVGLRERLYVARDIKVYEITN